MKNRKKILPVLVALFLLMMPTIQAKAADDDIYVEVPSGSTSAKVTFEVKNVLALEGTASTGKTNGFKVKSVTVSGAKSDSWTATSPESDKVVVIGSNLPADLKITVQLESSSPMKNGSYKVKFSYGKTRPDGSYASGRTEEAMIYVGVEAPKEEEEKETTSSSSSSNKTTSKVTETETVVQGEVNTEEEGDSDRADMLDLVDTSALRVALDEAQRLTGADMSSDQLERLLAAIEAGNAALESEDQETVDAATNALNEIIAELDGVIEEAEEEKPKPGSAIRKLWIILLILFIVFLLLLALLIWYLRKRKKEGNYEGAPLVDYNIEEDDAE